MNPRRIQGGATYVFESTIPAAMDGRGNADRHHGVDHAGHRHNRISRKPQSPEGAGTLAAADEGKTIKVRVSFTDDADNEETLTSAATATVEATPNSPATGTPTISGIAQVGETLTADTSGIADEDGLNGFVGDNWDPAPDEDRFAADLEQRERYWVRLRTKTGQPERHQATQLKILGIHDSDGNAISGTASAGAAGKKVFITNWQAPGTGRYYIAVGSKGTDRTGTYWISITKNITD